MKFGIGHTQKRIPRGPKHEKLDSLFKGVPPYKPSEAQMATGLRVNEIDKIHSELSARARKAYASAFSKPK